MVWYPNYTPPWLDFQLPDEETLGSKWLSDCPRVTQLVTELGLELGFSNSWSGSLPMGSEDECEPNRILELPLPFLHVSMALQENDREMYHQEEDIVFLMALPDSVTAHASSAFCPHDICSLIPECDHLCFVISRLISIGILSLYMVMGLASGLLTGQCGLTLPPVPRHRARLGMHLPHGWTRRSPSRPLRTNLLCSSQMAQGLRLWLTNKQTNKQTQNHTILEMERPSEVTGNTCGLWGPGKGRGCPKVISRSEWWHCSPLRPGLVISLNFVQKTKETLMPKMLTFYSPRASIIVFGSTNIYSISTMSRTLFLGTRDTAMNKTIPWLHGDDILFEDT